MGVIIVHRIIVRKPTKVRCTLRPPKLPMRRVMVAKAETNTAAMDMVDRVRLIEVGVQVQKRCLSVAARDADGCISRKYRRGAIFERAFFITPQHAVLLQFEPGNRRRWKCGTRSVRSKPAGPSSSLPPISGYIIEHICQTNASGR